MFNVNDVSNYVNANSRELLTKAVLGSDTVVFNVYTGVKGRQKIHLADFDTVLQNAACSWDASGGTTLTDREVSVVPIDVKETYCDLDLRPTFENYQIKYAAGLETIGTFEEFIANKKLEDVQEKVDKMSWQGDSSLGVAGVLTYVEEYLDASTGVAVGSGNTPTEYATAKAAIDALYMSIPEKLIDKVNIYISEAGYRAYTAALVQANMFHYDGQYGNREIYIPGTNVRVIARKGLNGSKTAIALNPENFVWAVDIDGAENKAKFFFDEGNDVFKLKIRFGIGGQVAFPNEVMVANFA